MVVRNWSDLVDAILFRKVSFVVTFFVVFITTYAILSWLDFLPELVVETESIEETVAKEEALVEPVLNNNEAAPVLTTTESLLPLEPILPISLYIESLDKKVNVLNPSSRDVVDLDNALLSGVVRHPDSATLEQNGTVFLLGHSSYLPVVNNKSFQAFNGIQNLKWGDMIKLTTADGEYTYRVDRVYRARASEVTIPIAGPTKRLVLATCNSFGSVDDRYIVEADLVENVDLKS